MALLSLFGAPNAVARPAKTGGTPATDRVAELDRRAQQAEKQRRYDAAQRAYRRLVEQYPTHSKRCFWQYRLTATEASGHTLLQHVRAIMGLVALYQRLRSQSRHRESELAQCRDWSGSLVRDVAYTLARRATKERLPHTLTQARALFEIYLENFGSPPDGGVFRFWYAEQLFKLRDWDMASKAYAAALGEGLKEPEASEAWIAHARALLNILDPALRLDDGSGIRRRAEARTIVPLSRAFEHLDAKGKSELAAVFGRIGPRAAVAVPALERALTRGPSTVRKASAAALAKVCP